MRRTGRRFQVKALLGVFVAILALAGGMRIASAQDDISDADLETLIQETLPFLSSDDPATRSLACSGLERLCDRYGARAKKSCVPAFVKCLADEEQVANTAIFCLVRCGELSVKPLLECLGSEKPRVKKNAVIAFQRLSSELDVSTA